MPGRAIWPAAPAPDRGPGPRFVAALEIQDGPATTSAARGGLDAANCMAHASESAQVHVCPVRHRESRHARASVFGPWRFRCVVGPCIRFRVAPRIRFPAPSIIPARCGSGPCRCRRNAASPTTLGIRPTIA
ncbi:hypothetical protein AMAG_11035 [Allomyces macrogynus ATCC 38327]|uniref:Uncharacterized protein n=1 Tax=Allomyces macrogynus (strain ATCC 38327) TaxID=578462 RepID=A0A0L0SST8_ALLM3|nr:hypothetical protein AMAG_11035 [Allomyces macrogynus ATCC 38327]|eukprot:KNE65404.1 hypothetical protein AMAG_11035 [Allomyces macrogynus ATCC 38327]